MEYVAATTAVNHAIWLRKLMFDLALVQEKPTPIHCDNKSAVLIAKNPIFHGRTKHFKIKFHVVREAQSEVKVLLVQCSSEDQLVDILTKLLSRNRFEKMRSLIGMMSLEEFAAN